MDANRIQDGILHPPSEIETPVLQYPYGGAGGMVVVVGIHNGPPRRIS